MTRIAPLEPPYESRVLEDQARAERGHADLVRREFRAQRHREPAHREPARDIRALRCHVVQPVNAYQLLQRHDR